MPLVKTAVLERFNELFSEGHKLMLVEDINNTFTTEKNRELKISMKILGLSLHVNLEMKLNLWHQTILFQL